MYIFYVVTCQILCFVSSHSEMTSPSVQCHGNHQDINDLLVLFPNPNTISILQEYKVSSLLSSLRCTQD